MPLYNFYTEVSCYQNIGKFYLPCSSDCAATFHLLIDYLCYLLRLLSLSVNYTSTLYRNSTSHIFSSPVAKKQCQGSSQSTYVLTTSCSILKCWNRSCFPESVPFPFHAHTGDNKWLFINKRLPTFFLYIYKKKKSQQNFPKFTIIILYLDIM